MEMGRARSWRNRALFFQAEDGMRGRNVTGVQTCALPISLGCEFIDADVEAGTIEVAFGATEAFTNPAGNVLGAFVAAMLYDTVGPALLAVLEPDQFQSRSEERRVGEEWRCGWSRAYRSKT